MARRPQPGRDVADQGGVWAGGGKGDRRVRTDPATESCRILRFRLRPGTRPRRRGDRMRRRELMLLLGGAMIAARAVRAQQNAMPVIGFLNSTSPGPFAAQVAAFHQRLSETGYVEGQNVVIEYRWAEGRDDRLAALAADLVGRNVDVIVAGSSIQSALVAKNATSTIPIVFPGISDPGAAGLVAI